MSRAGPHAGERSIYGGTRVRPPVLWLVKDEAGDWGYGSPLREIEKMSGAERSTKETQLAGMPAWPLLCEEWFTPCRPYIGTDLGTNVVPRRAAMCAACLQAPVEAARFLGRELLGHRRAEKGAVNKCALVLFVVHQPHATATMVTGMS